LPPIEHTGVDHTGIEHTRVKHSGVEPPCIVLDVPDA
jgi:hypothetical protein